VEERQCQRKMKVPNRAASNQAQEVVTRNRVRVEHCRPEVGTEEAGQRETKGAMSTKEKGQAV